MTSIRPQAFGRIAHTLSAIRRRLLARDGLSALGWAVASLALLGLAVVLWAAFGGGHWLRTLAWAGGALALLYWIGWRFGRAAWGWRPDDAVAEHVEQGLPGLRDGLRASVQFARQWPEVAGSPAMVARLAEGVADHLGDADLRPVVPFSPLRRPFGAVGVALAAWGVVGLLAPSVLTRGFAALQPPVTVDGAIETGPLVGDLELTLTYPPYMDRAVKVIPNSAGDFEAPKGTRVAVRAVSLEPVRQASLRFGEADAAQPLAVAGARELSGAFTVTAAGRWRFAVETVGGEAQVESTPRRLRLEVDRVPEVTLMVPEADMTLKDLRDVPVVFEARDDIDLGQVNVVVGLAEDPDHVERIAQPAVKGRRYTGDETVDLTVVQAQPGDRVAIYVEALDTNDVDGPQRGVSATRYITVDSPHQKHFELTERLRATIEALLTALGDRLEVELYARDGLPPLPEALGALARTTDAAIAAVSAVVDEMADDPLTPDEVRLALAGRLGTLEAAARASDALVARLTPALATGTRSAVDQVNKANEQVVDALEQAVVLVEAMVARLALEDMEALAQELQEMRARLKDLISEYKQNPDDAALKARIMREIQRLRRRMQEMQARMAQLRQKLPEEFLNLDGLKKDEVSKGLDKTKDQLAELEKMLNEGKIDDALAALEEMEAALDELSQTLDKDMQSLHEESDPALQKAISELMDQTKDLMREQQAVADETEAMKAEADAKMKQLMEETFKERLADVTRKADQLKRETAQLDAGQLPRPAQDDMQFAREQADALRKALDRQQLMEALESAEEARQHLRNADQMSRYDRRADGQRPRLKRGEQLAEEIGDSMREMIQQARQQMSQAGDGEASQALGKRQQQLAERAQQLRQRVGEQAKQLPQLGADAEKRIEQAGQAMQQAGEQLKRGKAGQARPGQQQAMSELDGMLQALKQANRPQRAQRGEDGQQPGQGRRSSREKVKIPGAADHAAPEAFRKDLLDAMKDEAPEAYREQVKRYYESLIR